MPDEVQVLVRLLSMAALLGATIEYSRIIHRRGEMRERLREVAASQAAAHRALVRIRLLDRI